MSLLEKVVVISMLGKSRLLTEVGFMYLAWDRCI